MTVVWDVRRKGGQYGPVETILLTIVLWTVGSSQLIVNGEYLTDFLENLICEFATSVSN